VALVTVVIPAVEPLKPDNVTLNSLARQTLKGVQIVVQMDEQKRGASWARNRGFQFCRSEFVLFSDDDVKWEPRALKALIGALRREPTKAWVYGIYLMEGQQYGSQEWDPQLLKKFNYITTMSLIRTKLFPGFDESIQRLQDWDVWLTMASRGMEGLFLPQILFTTYRRAGITFGNELTWEEAAKVLRMKHARYCKGDL